MQKMLDNLGQRLKDRRMILELTQEKLSELSEVDTSYIGQAERGLRKPSLKVLHRLAKALNLEMYELFLPDETKSRSIKSDEQFISDFKKLPRDKKKALKKLYRIVSDMK